jgi:hypothetical protein
MSGMWPNIVAGIVQAIVAGLIGFLVAYLGFRWRQHRAIVEYETFSMPLLRLKQTQMSPMVVSVDKSLLTASEDDKGQLVQVDSAYGYEVEVQNIGNQAISDCTIEIELDKDAKIIVFETHPLSRPGYDIKTERDDKRLNVLRVTPPYINKKEEVVVRLTSTGNSSRRCNVNVLGKDLRVRKRALSYWGMFSTMLALLAIVSLLAAIRAAPPGNPVIDWAVEVLHAEVRQETRIDWPSWLDIVSLVPILSVYVAVIWVTFSRMRKQQRRQEVWEATEKSSSSSLSAFFRGRHDST